MSHLEQLESHSIYLVREAYKRFGDAGMATLWSMGKDSTTLLWIIRKAFLGNIPFPVVHIDTTYKFEEMYEFRDRLAADWNLPLRVIKNDEALADGMNKARGRFNCCHLLKTKPLEQAVIDARLKAVCLAIRRDEHGVRAKERYVSPRGKDFTWDVKNQPMELWEQFDDLPKDESIHLRIHPLLDWTELDIWQYIAKENIPVISMYFARDVAGKSVRYRSIGCAPCTSPVPSSAKNVSDIVQELATTTTAEREGRAQDKESSDTMQKLRALGYM